jgi:subtilase family serine protease
MENEPMPAEDDVEQTSDTEPTKKITPFQIAVIVLLSILAVVLVGFLVVYALKKSDNSQVTDQQDQKTASSEEKKIDTNVAPPSVSPTPSTSNTDAVSDTSTSTSSETKKPDLYVKSYDLSETPKVGDEFTVKITIGNKGATAQSFSWEWWPTSSGRDCKGSVDSLSYGGTKVVECTYAYDDVDEYATKFIVDSKDEVDESDEGNNVYTQKINILKKADLTISDYDFDHDPVQGEEFTVRIKIKNKGETDAEDFYWEWWPTITGSKACHKKIDILKAGDSETVECDYTYGGWANYTTKAVVDADGDVDESDESNNTYTENVIPIH